MPMSTRTERWSVELLFRYICATLVTLIAAAGAQLVVRTDFTVAIAIVSFLGAPVSLYLRLHGMRIAGFSLSRPLWNTFTVVLFFVCAGAWTLISMSDLLSLMLSGGASQSFWLRFGAEGSLALLMQVFLLFAAFRSFALISDKDATLATVPSFSVLLLLIPVHKGIEVVLYFLIWTLAATILFALDHRAELNDGADGRILSPTPGQDVRLAARGLATVMGAALVAAFSLSALLTSRNADDRSATESAITGLVGRLAQFAMSSPDSSLSGGPERQIDFSSGPSLPSRALLWQMRVWIPGSNRVLRPGYFRLFTLARYNGSTWTQAPREQKRVRLANLSPQDWPLQYRFPFGSDSNGNSNSLGFGGLLPSPAPSVNVIPPGITFQPDSAGTPLRQDQLIGRPKDNPVPDSFLGFALRKAWPKMRQNFGTPTLPVRVSIRANTNNVGFIPLLANTRALFLRQGHVDELRTGSDGAVDMGFVAQEQGIRTLADVPIIAEYGVSSAMAPTKKVVGQEQSPQLPPSDRDLYLQLPALSTRARHFAQNVLVKAPEDESNYGHARRLAFAIQQKSTYTLRPPIPPQGREATDFFLFDGNRRGYCTHFASALTVLCRSQGIPARIVSGFAAQEYSSDGTAQLREANAHAWTEVWVDNWGWAPVDATPTTDRGDNAPNIFSYWGDWFGFAFNQIEMWSRSRLWPLGIGFGMLIVGVYVFRRRTRIMAWWARRRGYWSSDELTRRDIIAAYDMASVRLSRLFRPRAPFETPDEWLSAAKDLVLDSPRARLFARHEFEQLTEYYLRALYAPQAPEHSSVAVARELARQVRRNKG
ncbi:protein-glutamine gamma-glutamyltransferase [Abditibacteriota bacterium]|nr:protein-glutamine gamma-glutamyltransferase [Abditibacteriota bacterium]